jgi:hypothetical protein
VSLSRRTPDAHGPLLRIKGQVLELHSRGIVYTAIADTLNMSDSRVKDIIRAAAALSGRHNGQPLGAQKGVGLLVWPCGQNSG